MGGGTKIWSNNTASAQKLRQPPILMRSRKKQISKVLYYVPCKNKIPRGKCQLLWSQQVFMGVVDASQTNPEEGCTDKHLKTFVERL